MKKELLFCVTLSLSGLALANEHTIVFDGENDMYGLQRQTTVNVNSLEFVQDFSFKEDGIEFSIKNTDPACKGFALVNAGGTNAGLFISSVFFSETTQFPEVTLSVPDGKITGVKLYMSGDGLMSVKVPFNGEDASSQQEGKIFFWTWKDQTGVETVDFTIDNSFLERYIHSIEISYTADLGGKEECGLKFDSGELEVIMGQDFTTPSLSNPHNLPILWSSSDENVATVDSDGVLTLIGGGKTMITASTEGDGDYAAGNAKYDLTVVPSASNLLLMAEYAPTFLERVYVDFPLTVTYANGALAYVLDAENNASCIENTKNATSSSATTIYKVGNVIPKGWIATNYTINESQSWRGVPPEVSETVAVEYPLVDSVTPQDANRVVTLKDVTFTTDTASGYESAFGTTADGTEYIFQDSFGIGSKPAGSYNVTGVVNYSKSGSREYFFIAPIAYENVQEGGVSNIDYSNTTPAYFNLQGVEVSNPNPGIYIQVINQKASKIAIK
ncbi:MAG: hypothetical protein K2H96_00830 [Muribaculaceae bacterium]|nr:hypothetical protein [Muribaculaceae bacterium]